MVKTKELVERFKEKADIFLDEDIRAFIVTVNGDWHYCDVILVTDKYIYVKHFSGKKAGQKERIFFVDILKFEEYENEN